MKSKVLLYQKRLVSVSLTEPLLGSNLFSDKASHENKHLFKISFSDDI